MRAYAIVIKGNEISEKGFKKLSESFEEVDNEFPLKRFDAITPKTADNVLDNTNIKWNYPWQGEVIDFATGLTN